jgi:hypothetical protein
MDQKTQNPYSKERVVSPGWKGFAGVRGRVKRALQAQPPSVTLADAMKQIALFEASRKTS